ncbi:SRPBCC family protein [Pseudoroseicyclus tamaricis]|uniref:SRPBCC family protein n=1 Tax=Pseudoroseicyclus tamaricis TaxID=2705421 RepID=A0A6B2JNR3_9RHOB|nr:SRPBCC family protein [Pseudoroseicyclus tamaricis]NDU99619.1 SRPBCC family protein [Pseudoroseicyclus tamaricis]
MELSAEAEIAAPIDWSFDRFADFEAFARMGRKRGARVERIDPGAPIGPGSGWDVAFEMRGRERMLKPRMTEWAPPGGFALVSDSEGLILTVRTTFSALGPERTRVRLEVEAEGKSMAAKLMLQPMRLGRGKLEGRLQDRLTGYCAELSALRAG